MNDSVGEPLSESLQKDYPTFHTSGVNLAVSGMDFRLVFTEQLLVFSEKGEMRDDPDVKINGIASMSLHTAKDLVQMLSEAVADIESRFGSIETPFLHAKRMQEAENESRAKDD